MAGSAGVSRSPSGAIRVTPRVVARVVATADSLYPLLGVGDDTDLRVTMKGRVALLLGLVPELCAGRHP
jgi:hypothetical protein